MEDVESRSKVRRGLRTHTNCFRYYFVPFLASGLIKIGFGFGFSQITHTHTHTHTRVYVVRVLVSTNQASHLRSAGRGFDARSARACM